MRARILGWNLPICLRISDFHGGRVQKDLTFSFSSWSRSSSFRVFWGANDNFVERSSALCQPHLHPNRLALKILGPICLGEFRLRVLKIFGVDLMSQPQ